MPNEIADAASLSTKATKALETPRAATALKETKKNGLLVLPDIGRLVKSKRKARMGRNPATGEANKIAAKTVVKFRVAKAAQDFIAPSKAKKK